MRSSSMSIDGSVEQQDSRGWTPIMWSACNGYSKLVKQLIQRGANVHHMGQARSGPGSTQALHECVAMRGEGGQQAEAFFETAWLLMEAGASPFAERSDGAIPIEVAAAGGNIKMKTFLESCSLFRGTLAMAVPQTFGTKVKKRYCTVQPRFPFGNAAPSLWMVCYKTPGDAQPCCRIPLSSARVMIEGQADSDSGIIIIPGTGRALRGVAVKSHTSNSFIIEIRAVGSAAVPGWRTLRTLADVCKAAAVAVSCRNLDQLCAAALRQATRQMRIPGADTLLSAEQPPPPQTPQPPQQQQQQQPPPPPPPLAKSLSLPMVREGGEKEGQQPPPAPGPMTDSAEDIKGGGLGPHTPSPGPPPKPPAAAASPAPSPQATPRHDTPRPARPAESGPRRSSVSLGALLKGTFGRRSSVAGPRAKYAPDVLDSNSSLSRQASAASLAPDTPRTKSGVWSGLKRTISGKAGPAPAAPAAGGGLTEADIHALSQPIPDKFWSRIGRKMSTQRPGSGFAPPGPARPQWFHDDGGRVAGAGGSPLGPGQQRPSFTSEEMNELMFPANQAMQQQQPAPQLQRTSTGSGSRRPRGDAGAGAGALQGPPPLAVDNVQGRAAANGTVPFILEEPIVPTQEMVPTGPRRSFSFDDLDDLMSGANRKARGHREGYAQHMAPQPGAGAAAAAGPGSRPPQTPGPAAGASSGGSGRVPWQPAAPMPRRSFSLHNIDEMLRPAPQPQPMQTARSVQDELEAWRRSQQPQQPQQPPHQGAKPPTTPRKKRGPAIDPFSHGGYVGEPAPEWRPYKAPSARPASGGLQRSASAAAGQHGGSNSRTNSGGSVQAHAQAQAQAQAQARPLQQLPPAPQQAGRPAALPRSATMPHPQQQQPLAPLAPLPQPLPQPQAVPAPFMRPQALGASLDSPVETSTSSAHQGVGDDGIPPELAHLASLRPLDTGNLSNASFGRDHHAATSLAASQDLSNVDVPAPPAAATAASGLTQDSALTTLSRELDGPQQQQQQQRLQQDHPPQPTLANSLASSRPPSSGSEAQSARTSDAALRPSIQVSPAVPTVLFSGAKAPRIATPPQRTSDSSAGGSEGARRRSSAGSPRDGVVRGRHGRAHPTRSSQGGRGGGAPGRLSDDAAATAPQPPQ